MRGEMLRSLAEGREPVTSARNNLNSIRIAQAAVRALESGHAVDLAKLR